MTTIKLLEMYPAIQGEGTLIGQPSTFIRLAGCTVGCVYCDTKYSWKASQGEVVSPEEVYTRAKEMTTHGHVVLTGGEPLEHPEASLIETIRLLQTIFHVTVETSGTGVDPRDFVLKMRSGSPMLWSVAPKLKYAQSTKGFPDLNEWIVATRMIGHDLQLKFVVRAEVEGDTFEVEKYLEEIGGVPERVTVILQVATNPTEKNPGDSIVNDLRRLQERVTQSRLFPSVARLRVLPQLHAILYGQKRGV